MKKPFSNRSMQATLFQAASETAASEFNDFHTRFAFSGEPWCAGPKADTSNYPVP
ncbi:hypothetical protein [Sinorhizobium meliloti]|uniref:hypothetical protein n=1 Tax=Rhizobium meliloti TaxID=382 RepID=UPI0013E3D563|nr:hypothetical protein [Sinorhizobium meliloti]MCO6424521.1 hypothetical protein [Sinorhizobium meliloti]